MPIHPLEFSETRSFSKLMTDYLLEDERVEGFIHRFPSDENLIKQQQEKAQHPIHRKVLCKALKKQYSQSIPTWKEEYPGLEQRIDALESEGVFTVTTGHQLNLAGGPLYFLYKIAGTIALAKRLNAKNPGFKTLPVFWMATEDHDWAEVNHFYFKGKKFESKDSIPAAVGRAKADLAMPVLEELRKEFGHIEQIQECLERCLDAYAKAETLADATRILVQQLFADSDLLILDADDRELKALMVPMVKEELFGTRSADLIESKTQELANRYFAQVNPREINLFYLDDRLRGRITVSPDGFEVVDGHMLFDQEQLEDLMENEPEKFSPNVVLRPLFQEMILPNLAYLGGGGELAYWMQLKPLFEHYKLPFPVLILRTSMVCLSEKAWRRIRKYDFRLRDLFLDPNHYMRKSFFNESGADRSLTKAMDDFQAISDYLRGTAERLDPTLVPSVEAELAKQERGMKRLRKKFFRAVKRREKHTFQNLEAIREEIFPEGVLQERRDSVFDLSLHLNQEMISFLIEEMDPLKKRFIIFEPLPVKTEG